MAIFVIGGTGFIGTRVIRLLAARGEEIVCMDINPSAASFDDLGKQVRVMRGDVTQFDDVMAATTSAKPSRIINCRTSWAVSIRRISRPSSTSSAWTTASRPRVSPACSASCSPVRWR
jgi:nucleoside-diphosphate-sugar epimerase